jgi:hypothetical protein
MRPVGAASATARAKPPIDMRCIVPRQEEVQSLPQARVGMPRETRIAPHQAYSSQRDKDFSSPRIQLSARQGFLLPKPTALSGSQRDKDFSSPSLQLSARQGFLLPTHTALSETRIAPPQAYSSGTNKHACSSSAEVQSGMKNRQRSARRRDSVHCSSRPSRRQEHRVRFVASGCQLLRSRVTFGYDLRYVRLDNPF